MTSKQQPFAFLNASTFDKPLEIAAAAQPVCVEKLGHGCVIAAFRVVVFPFAPVARQATPR